MEFSALRIRPCPTGSIQLLAHPPVGAARMSKAHLSFPSFPLSFPKGSPGHAVLHIRHPITCKFDGLSFPSKKKEGESSNSRSTRVALALACALGIIGCSGMVQHKAFASPSSTTAARINIEVKTAMDQLMQSRGADEAEKYLRKTVKAFDEDYEAGYRARVALLEVLMHRGKYKEAAQLGQLICQNEYYQHLIEKDGKFHLLQVFIHGMLNDKKKTKESWKNFTKTCKSGLPRKCPE